MGRSAGGGVGAVPILPPVGPSCAWRGAATSGSVCQFRVCSCLLGHCTRSVGNAPLLFGCTAPYRVQRPRACGGCGGCRGCGGLLGVGCLPLGLASGLGASSVFWAWVVFCLGLCCVSCCGSSEMSHVIPPRVFQTLKSHRWNCNVLGRCTKFGHPNYVRVLVDEAPEASSCVRPSSHDTVHDPRDTSNTTPTPQNAKSLLTPSGAVGPY